MFRKIPQGWGVEIARFSIRSPLITVHLLYKLVPASLQFLRKKQNSTEANTVIIIFFAKSLTSLVKPGHN